jgi:hypothetical protein
MQQGGTSSDGIRWRYFLYTIKDDYRDWRDYIWGRPNYVGGYEEWCARKAALERGEPNPITISEDPVNIWSEGVEQTKEARVASKAKGQESGTDPLQQGTDDTTVSFGALRV